MAAAIIFMYFLPASQILFPVGFLLAERVLYLPSMGICIIFATIQEYALSAVWSIWQQRPYGKIRQSLICAAVAAIVLVPTIPLAVMTMHRSADWGNEVRLWQNAVVVNPKNHNNFFSFGDTLMKDPSRAAEAEYYLR